MIAIICGGRKTTVQQHLFVLQDLDSIEGITHVFEGGAPGVDAAAHVWARNVGKPVSTFWADWDTWGRAAGPIRNKRMLDAGAEIVIAYPGGPGTYNMCKQAREHGLRVIERSWS